MKIYYIKDTEKLEGWSKVSETSEQPQLRSSLSLINRELAFITAKLKSSKFQLSESESKMSN